MEEAEFGRVLEELMYPEGMWVMGEAAEPSPVEQIAKGLLDRFDIEEKPIPVDMEYAVVYGDDNTVYRGSIFANVYGAMFVKGHYKLDGSAYRIAEREVGATEWTIVK